ncbi:MAG: alpha/beta hydrolase, partial [Pseudomonadota bacterium]
RDRQGNRLIQWISRQKARRWAEMMDRKQHQVLAESVRAFRDARAKEAAVKPLLMDDAFRDTTREPVVDGLGEWISAKTAPDDAAILYVPGGAFIMKRSDRMTALAARLARMSEARLRIADYRLAPEHPCPAAVDDVESALLGLYDDGYDPSKVVVACDSAGGSIAMAVLLRLKARGEPMPAGLAMFSPWLDLALTGYSLLSSGLSGVSPFTMEMTALCARLYLQDKVLAVDPDASPLFGDLSGLPPILVHVSQEDSFFDDSKFLAQRIQDVDGKMLMRVWPMGGHVWEHDFTVDADQSIMETARFIRGRFEGAEMLY